MCACVGVGSQPASMAQLLLTDLCSVNEVETEFVDGAVELCVRLLHNSQRSSGGIAE